MHTLVICYRLSLKLQWKWNERRNYSAGHNLCARRCSWHAVWTAFTGDVILWFVCGAHVGTGQTACSQHRIILLLKAIKWVEVINENTTWMQWYRNYVIRTSNNVIASHCRTVCSWLELCSIVTNIQPHTVRQWSGINTNYTEHDLINNFDITPWMNLLGCRILQR